MPKKSLRRRPSTPNLKFQRHPVVDPTSPPETPTTSPPLSRKISQKPRHQPPFFDDYVRSLAEDSAILPVGNGHQFSYRPSLGPEQLSPRSASSSSDESESEQMQDSADDESSERASIGSLPDADDPDTSEEEEEEEEEEDNTDEDDDDSEDDGPLFKQRHSRTTVRISTKTTATATTVEYDFTIEDVDPMDSGCEGLDVLLPTEIESNRSRSRSRHKELPPRMMRDLQNLNCSNEASDAAASDASGRDPSPDPDVEFRRRQQELKRIRRVSMSSSFGKRTHSELSGDSDDDGSALDVNEMGASARRMRKRLHRGSLLFQDPPAPRIDELEEPDSSEDDYGRAEQTLARELPFFTLEIMDMGES